MKRKLQFENEIFRSKEVEIENQLVAFEQKNLRTLELLKDIIHETDQKLANKKKVDTYAFEEKLDEFKNCYKEVNEYREKLETDIQHYINKEREKKKTTRILIKALILLFLIILVAVGIVLYFSTVVAKTSSTNPIYKTDNMIINPSFEDTVGCSPNSGTSKQCIALKWDEDPNSEGYSLLVYLGTSLPSYLIYRSNESIVPLNEVVPHSGSISLRLGSITQQPGNWKNYAAVQTVYLNSSIIETDYYVKYMNFSVHCLNVSVDMIGNFEINLKTLSIGGDTKIYIEDQFNLNNTNDWNTYNFYLDSFGTNTDRSFYGVEVHLLFHSSMPGIVYCDDARLDIGYITSEFSLQTDAIST